MFQIYLLFFSLFPSGIPIIPLLHLLQLSHSSCINYLHVFSIFFLFAFQNQKFLLTYPQVHNFFPSTVSTLLRSPSKTSFISVSVLKTLELFIVSQNFQLSAYSSLLFLHAVSFIYQRPQHNNCSCLNSSGNSNLPVLSESASNALSLQTVVLTCGMYALSFFSC